MYDKHDADSHYAICRHECSGPRARTCGLCGAKGEPRDADRWDFWTLAGEDIDVCPACVEAEEAAEAAASKDAAA